MKSDSNVQVRKYLPPSYHQQLHLESFEAIKVFKKYANSVIFSLKKIVTKIEHLAHLKRVKKEEKTDYVIILICLTRDQETKLSIRPFYEQLNDILLQKFDVTVPFNAPKTKEQYERWSKYWPTVFIQPQIYKEVRHNEQELSLLTEALKMNNGLVVLSGEELLLGCGNEDECKKGTINHPVMRLLDEWPQSARFKHKQFYYLTDLWVVAKSSICEMCAMALVHSRLSRFYFTNEKDIQEVSQILCSQKLNHRISLFKLSAVPNDLSSL